MEPLWNPNLDSNDPITQATQGTSDHAAGCISQVLPGEKPAVHLPLSV